MVWQLILLLGLVVSTGCTSSLHLGSARDLPRFNGGARPVYVTNPELKEEYEVLRASGIYPLSTERDGARLLTLHPIVRYGRCGNPLMLTIFTCGIVPGVLPAARVFEYDLQTDGTTETRSHPLALYERFSIWERLLPHNDQRKMAEALARSSLLKPKEMPIF